MMESSLVAQMRLSICAAKRVATRPPGRPFSRAASSFSDTETPFVRRAGLLSLLGRSAQTSHRRRIASQVKDAIAHEVLDARSAASAVQVLRQHTDLVHACDTEVAELDIRRSPIGQGRVICVSIYSGAEIDFGSGRGRALWIDTTAPGVLDELRGWFEDERARKVWHNYGFDRHVLHNHGIDARGFAGDTMHMARLWDASRKAGYSLEVLTAVPCSPRSPPDVSPVCTAVTRDLVVGAHRRVGRPAEGADEGASIA
jgi:hypothetical protein